MTASLHRVPPTLAVACALALAAAVSLGLARFSYALLLPPMRADLSWSYFLGGAMNTANAVGYLTGALLAPRWLARFDARAVLLAGGAAAVLALSAHAVPWGDGWLLLCRWATGVASAASFVAGGLLAARLASTPPQAGSGRPVSPGLVLGLYYGGTGIGIVASALLVPPITGLAVAHPWQWAWLGLAAAAAVATAITASMTGHLRTQASDRPPGARFERRTLGWGLAGYFMFGLGYIGYMTFVVTLLREQQLPEGQIVGFFALLGTGVMASSFLWAGLLQRSRGGGAMALLNALLATATLLPVLSTHPAAVWTSGLLFGSVFLSVVASTTAMVRHNLAPAAWPAGIAAFTIMFAAGQIVGPSAVGWIADGPGGLLRGFAYSAAVLALGAVLAIRQRPLPTAGAVLG